MELMKYLLNDKWVPATSHTLQGMRLYTIIRSERFMSETNQPSYRYAIKQVCNNDIQGKLAMVTLSGVSGRNDPLRNIRNAELLIGQDNEIKAINVDGDCVVERIRSVSADSG